MYRLTKVDCSPILLLSYNPTDSGQPVLCIHLLIFFFLLSSYMGKQQDIWLFRKRSDRPQVIR